MMKYGYSVYDRPQFPAYLIRSYIAESLEQAEQAAKIEFPDVMFRVNRTPRQVAANCEFCIDLTK